MAAAASKVDHASPRSASALDRGLGGTAPRNSRASSSKSKAEEVVDSWEDEDVSSDAEDTSNPSSSSKPPPSTTTKCDASTVSPGAQPSPPLPPAMLSSSSSAPLDCWDSNYNIINKDTSNSNSNSAARRPEKTDAVAQRLIAAGLGLKPPRLTEEQRAYQKSVRERERRRKDEQRVEEERRTQDAARAKAAVWDD